MYYVAHRTTGEIEAHTIFNSVRYIDFMLLSAEQVEEYIKEDPDVSQYFKSFDTLEEVKKYCYGSGVDFLCHNLDGGERHFELCYPAAIPSGFSLKFPPK